MRQEQIQQTAETLTNTPSVVTTGGGVTAMTMANWQNEIVWGLTAIVLTCQIIAYAYRFKNYLKSKREERKKGP